MANEILSVVRPWSGEAEAEILCAVLNEKERPELASGISDGIRDLIQRCWNDASTERPSMEDCRNICQKELDELIMSMSSDTQWTDEQIRRWTSFTSLSVRYSGGIEWTEDGIPMELARLPPSEQTHEIVLIKNYLIITQLPESVLIRLELKDGSLLGSTMKAWGVGPERKVRREGYFFNGRAELHDVKVSTKFPHSVYLTLQVPNLVCVVDAESPDDGNCAVIQLPHGAHQRGQYVAEKIIGGPHCLREDSERGIIWVCMKGTQGAIPKSLRAFAEYDCCDPDRISKDYEDDARMATHYGLVKCRIGGSLNHIKPVNFYECLRSPPQVALFNNGDIIASQDECGHLLYISTKERVCQIPIPFVQHPSGPCEDIGNRHRLAVGAVAAEKGDVIVVAMHAQNACLCFVTQSDDVEEPIKTKMHHLPGLTDSAGKGIRFLHLAFGSDQTRLYALSSSLIEGGDKISDAVVILKFTDGFYSDLESVRVIRLPTTGSKAHSILRDGDNDHLFITELTASQVVRIPNAKEIEVSDRRYRVWLTERTKHAKEDDEKEWHQWDH